MREAVAEVVLQLPAWALSSRASALLAYGLTRSCGVDKKLVAPLAADGAREISFQHYKYVEAPTQYGTSRKLLKLCEETAAIGDFMDQVYKPALKYYIYHRSHF